MSCSLFSKPQEKIVYVNNYCTIDSTIKPSQEDKVALKESKISKDFIQQLKDHNDLYRETCPKVNLKLNNIKLTMPQPTILSKAVIIGSQPSVQELINK